MTMDHLAALRRLLPGAPSIAEAVDAFETMCQLPIESECDDLLFETVPYGCADKPLLLCSLVRQYQPDGEDEFMQIHLDLYYVPGAGTDAFEGSFWSEDGDFAGFFRSVRESEAYRSLADCGGTLDKMDVYLDET